MDYRTKCILIHGNKCIICDTKKDIHAHHIDVDRKNNSIFNIIPLCSSCHKLAHLHPESSIHDSISKYMYSIKQFIKKYNTIKNSKDKHELDELGILDCQKKKIDSAGRLFLTTELKNKTVSILRIDTLNSIQYIIENETEKLDEEGDYKVGDSIKHLGIEYRFIGGDSSNLANWKQVQDIKNNVKLKERYKETLKVSKTGTISIGRSNANKDVLYKVLEDDMFEYHVFKVIKNSYIKDLKQKETISAPESSNGHKKKPAIFEQLEQQGIIRGLD